MKLLSGRTSNEEVLELAFGGSSDCVEHLVDCDHHIWRSDLFNRNYQVVSNFGGGAVNDG